MALPIVPPPVAAAAEAAPAEPPMSAMFANYDPQGSLNGLFAPAFIKGYAPSEQAVGAWHKKNNPVSYTDVDALRMPNKWMPPQPVYGYGDVYGAGRIPDKLRYGDDRGEVDPAALISLAQGGPYDVEARRDAIAQRIRENEEAAAAHANPAGAAPALGGMGGRGGGMATNMAAGMPGAMAMSAAPSATPMMGGASADGGFGTGNNAGPGVVAGPNSADSPIRLGGPLGRVSQYGGPPPNNPLGYGPNGEWLWWG